MKKHLFLKLLLSFLLITFPACNSSDRDALKGSIDEPDRKSLDTSIIGVNAFGNETRFGSPAAQYKEIKDVLRLNHLRLLFNWDNGVQGSPGASPSYSFYDSLINAVPANMDVVVVLTGVPSWMNNSANWIEGNPRTTFVERWTRPTVARYKNNPKIIAWQIWNEPNQNANSHNVLLDINDNPANYVEMLGRAFSVIRDVAPGDLVLNAATTSIVQNFPDTVDYNRAMRDAGAEAFVDIWAIHYYGRSFGDFLRDDGPKDFLRDLSKPIWVTESGQQGVNEQLAYAEQVWPFLRDEVPAIQRIYQYSFAENTPADISYGLRTPDASAPVSDLYIFLRDR